VHIMKHFAPRQRVFMYQNRQRRVLCRAPARRVTDHPRAKRAAFNSDLSAASTSLPSAIAMALEACLHY
jgi:hypothetical protein